MNPNSVPRKTWIIGGIVAAVILMCLCGGIGVSTFTGNSSDGKAKQAQLTAAYADAANYMSNCLVKTHQAANVAGANAAAFDTVIKDSIAGSGPAGQFNISTPTGQAGFFPLLVRAYPDLKGQTDLFAKVVTVIVGCQDDFRNKQSYVLDQVRVFNTWRGNFWVHLLGGGSFPDGDLVINIPGVPVASGMPALLKMGQPIISSDTSDAYKNGTFTPTDPFATAAPTPK